MKNKIKVFAKTSQARLTALVIRAGNGARPLSEAIADERGEEHSVARIVGVVMVVVLGLLLMGAFTGLFNDTLLPQIKEIFGKMFTFAP